MVKFDGERVQACIKHAKLCNKINIAFFTTFVAFGLIAAICTHYLGELGVWYLCVLGVILVAFVLYNVIFVADARRRVKREVAATLAEGFYNSEELLKGDKKIAFEVFYSNDVLTVRRTDFAGEIIVDPTNVKEGACLADSAGEIAFDLTALKTLPSVYSCAGTYVWEFLQAYYTVRFEEGKYDSISVTDRTTKRTFELAIVENGSLLGGNDKSYYIKYGIVK